MLSPCFFCFFPFLLVFFSEFLGKVCAYGFAIQLRAGRFYRVVEKNVSHFFVTRHLQWGTSSFYCIFMRPRRDVKPADWPITKVRNPPCSFSALKEKNVASLQSLRPKKNKKKQNLDRKWVGVEWITHRTRQITSRDVKGTISKNDSSA